MNWREPWRESKAHQSAMFALATCLGSLFCSPALWVCWDRWSEMIAVEEKILNQQEMAASLRRQTTQLQRSMTAPVLPVIDVQTLIALAPPSDLQFSRSSQEAPGVPPHLQTLHIQLLPIRFELHGSWAGWLQWLERWPTAAPGVTLSSLMLKSSAQSELAVQMAVVAAQRIEVNVAKDPKRVDANVLQAGGDPFDSQRWVQTKHQHAQVHPSYAQHVAPELLRAKEPLERFEREYLHYIGHISSGADLQALIRVHDPVRSAHGAVFAEVHRVRVGSHVGQNFGRVSIISPEKLVLDELTLTAGGQWQRQEVRMPLQERQP